jgi:hypothetical protein
MKYLIFVFLFIVNSVVLIAQNDSTTLIPISEIIQDFFPKDSTKNEINQNSTNIISNSLSDNLLVKSLQNQLFLIKDTSKEVKSLKSNTAVHITNLYIGVLVDNKIITHAGFVKSSGSNKGRPGIKGGSILVEKYETGEMVEWKDPVVSENYVSISSLKNKSSIALGDSTLQSGFYAVASIKDSANVNIHIELYPTLESCKSAVVRNANGIVFSIVPDKGSLRTHVIGFVEPDGSSDREISFFRPNIKRKK